MGAVGGRRPSKEPVGGVRVPSTGPAASTGPARERQGEGVRGRGFKPGRLTFPPGRARRVPVDAAGVVDGRKDGPPPAHERLGPPHRRRPTSPTGSRPIPRGRSRTSTGTAYGCVGAPGQTRGRGIPVCRSPRPARRLLVPNAYVAPGSRQRKQPKESVVRLAYVVSLGRLRSRAKLTNAAIRAGSREAQQLAASVTPTPRHPARLGHRFA